MKHPSLQEKLAIAVLAFAASISWIVAFVSAPLAAG